MSQLPHCNELFVTFFRSLFSDERWECLTYKMARPDIISYENLQGTSARELSNLNELGHEETMTFIENSCTLALENFSETIGEQVLLDFDGLDRIDQFCDEAWIQKLIDNSDPAEEFNHYVVTCLQLGAMIGTLIADQNDGLEWMTDSPTCESRLWHSQSAQVIPPFHWAIKKLSGYGFDDGMTDKIQYASQLLSQ